jgi:hypothetical protein
MFEHFTGNAPEKVAIIGCGPSMQDYVNIMAGDQSIQFHVDEVWGINAAGNVIKTDLDFIMDDYMMFYGHPDNPSVYLEKDVGHPVITSVPRKQCPNAVAFPLAEALAIPGARDYFNHTIAYVIAYAIIIGVKEICLFGCDYISKAKRYGEEADDSRYRYMACTAFWCGLASARGVNIIVTPNSPFLDADVNPKQRFYGYLTAPVVTREGN